MTQSYYLADFLTLLHVYLDVRKFHKCLSISLFVSLFHTRTLLPIGLGFLREEVVIEMYGHQSLTCLWSHVRARFLL